MSTTKKHTLSDGTSPIVTADDAGGHRPEFIPVDRNGNVVSGGGGGGGSGGDVTAPGVTGTLAQAVQGITGGVAMPISAAALTNIDADLGAISDAAAATDTGNASLIALTKRQLTKLPASLGQKSSAVSLPVVLASDQSALPTSGSITQALPDVTGAQLGTVYSFSAASGDVIGQKMAANGQAITYISIDPLTENSQSTITTIPTIAQPARVEIEAAMSQRVRCDYAVLELVSTETAATAPTAIALTSIQQATTTLTIVLATPFDGVIGDWVNVAGVVDTRLNYCNLCIATVSTDKLTLTATVADEATIPSLTVGPYASQGTITRVDQLLGSPNGYAIRLSGSSATAAAFLTRFGGNTTQAISGAFVGVQTVTTGSSASVYTSGATGQVEIKPTSRFQMIFDPEAVTLADRATDNALSGWTVRGQRTNVKPSGNVAYKLRFRTVAPISMTRPVAKIVSAVKAGTTTATITTDVAHGLATGNYVCISGIRDFTNFANLTTPTTITVTGSTTFTVVMALSATATSYGGTVTLSHGGIAQQGLLTQTVQSATRNTVGQVTLVGSAAWTGVNVGDLVNLHGCRVDTTGADLGIDGVYEVNTISTTTLILAPVQDYTNAWKSPTSNVSSSISLTNCGGSILARTTVRSHDIGLASYQQVQAQIDGQGTARLDKALPVTVQNSPAVTVSSGTITTVTTCATVTTLTTCAAVTSANIGIPGTIADVASAALTTTTTTAAFTPTFGCSYEVNVPVTVVSGTTPTLDIGIEESDDAGTNWFRIYDFPRITTTGMYRSPKLPLTGNRVRYVQTVTGTTPSFTRAINRLQASDQVNAVRQIVDRTTVPTTLNSVTPSLNIQNCRNVQVVVSLGAATTPQTTQLEGSDDNGATWYALGAALPGVASSTVQLTVPNVQSGLLRARVSTAGTAVTLNYVAIKGF